MNVKLLLKVKEAVLAEPKRLNMWKWLSVYNREENPEGPSCGTVGCISGWACVLAEKEVGHLKTFKGAARRLEREYRYGSAEGARVIGLTENQAAELFAPLSWPDDLDLCDTEEGTPEHAQIVAKGIDRFIANGGHW